MLGDVQIDVLFKVDVPGGEPDEGLSLSLVDGERLNVAVTLDGRSRSITLGREAALKMAREVRAALAPPAARSCERCDRELLLLAVGESVYVGCQVHGVAWEARPDHADTLAARGVPKRSATPDQAQQGFVLLDLADHERELKFPGAKGGDWSRWEPE